MYIYICDALNTAQPTKISSQHIFSWQIMIWTCSRVRIRASVATEVTKSPTYNGTNLFFVYEYGSPFFGC